jgi:hypothetical protein
MCKLNSPDANYKINPTATRPITDTARAVIRDYIMDKHNIKSRVNYRNTLMLKNKQTKNIGNDKFKHKTLGLRNKNIIIIIVIIQLNY